MLSVDKIRQLFLDFFAARNSHIEPSASLIPLDPSLLFTIAGMVPFKKMFLGLENKGYTRAASCQLCLRTNDLDNVGRTARHHTLFEMLGNFSFGDYFKEDAIKWGWEFITEDMKIDPDKLWVSIFTDDDESYDIWTKQAGVSPKRVVRLGEKDNFWRMGETGPCGPCSEILIDQGEELGCGRPDCAVGCDCDRYLELWNLVFTQFDRQADGTLEPLPQKNIDTGLGLERLAAVIQGKDNNYEIDNIFPLIEYTARLSGIKYKDAQESDASLKVIADHIRAITFLISDGVFPANEGRGYVLRRLIRRAIQRGRRLGLTKLFLYELVGVVVGLMKNAYPALEERREHISSVVKSEEERFHETLETGSVRVEELLAELKVKNLTTLPGQEAFRLYDTFGFPLELTREIAEEAGFTVDEDGFNAALEEQRERARGATGFSHEEAGDQKVLASLTEDNGAAATTFTGYEHLTDSGTVIRILKEGAATNEIAVGEEGALLLDKTSFYAESGGQVGDLGKLVGDAGEVEITRVTKHGGGLILHQGKVTRGTIKNGETLQTQVDKDLRQATAINHTATHILQAALRQVLGNHVKQSGSLVTPARFRFDFTHATALHERELTKIEELANEWIRADLPVKVDLTSYDAAIKAGTLAFFGEKYDQVVRLVSVGDISAELCGGTHLNRSGEIGLLKIIGESSVAAGIRRIEGVAGYPAFKMAQETHRILTEISRKLTVPYEEIEEKLDTLLTELKQKDKQLENLTSKRALSSAAELFNEVKVINGINCLASEIEGVKAKQLRELVDDLKNRIKSGVILLISPLPEGVAIVLGVTKDLTDKLNAGRLISSIAQVMGGKGGGRPDFAQAGGKDKTNIPQALEAIEELIRQS